MGVINSSEWDRRLSVLEKNLAPVARSDSAGSQKWVVVWNFDYCGSRFVQNENDNGSPSMVIFIIIRKRDRQRFAVG